MAWLSNANIRKVAMVFSVIFLIKVFLSYQDSFTFHEHSLPTFGSSAPSSTSSPSSLSSPASLPASTPASTPPPSTPESSEIYSIKPVAYIFPQYYAFEDNNRLHGEGFTEWVNVNKTTHNAFGLETIRPHESIGYYNGLAFETRQRQGNYLKDSGFYGAVFHHYWFIDRAIMDHVIQAMLIDGEPNIPFMLSWANEPWTARWDGGHGSDVLIDQLYGLRQSWRKHFDWLLPFFRHPQYIRSEGKIQFIVYNPAHMGDVSSQMFAAWRQWAVEEGLGGMDVIETRWGNGPDQWRGHPPDAINEFQPHAAGGLDQARFSSLDRLSRVYHRGTLVCWDNTPRHKTDGMAACLPACHPTPWQNHLVTMFRRIKSDPNPVGAENFFFVNALNEWGEGNSFEPSVQFSDGYGTAMRNALAVSEKEDKWPDHATQKGLIHEKEMEVTMNEKVSVCVLVQTSPEHSESGVFPLSTMLQSLQLQTNEKWRAVVYQTSRAQFPSLSTIVINALDPRITNFTIPEEVDLAKETAQSFTATDWILSHLKDVSSDCSNAKYILVTEGHNTYDANAFDALDTSTTDLVGLNYESRNTMWNHPSLQNGTWTDRCTRLEHPELTLSKTSAPTADSFDLAATFISLEKFLVSSLSLSAPPKSLAVRKTHPPTNPSLDPLYPLIEHLTNNSWTFLSPTLEGCQVKHNPTYTSCLKTGNFWFDSPLYNEVGCYTSTRFMEVVGAKSQDLQDADLFFFAEKEQGRCMRYKEVMFGKMVVEEQKLRKEVQSETGWWNFGGIKEREGET